MPSKPMVEFLAHWEVLKTLQCLWDLWEGSRLMFEY